MMAPAIALWLLIRQKASFIGIAKNNLVSLNIYFLLTLIFDILRTLTQSAWATYGILIGFFLMAVSFGHASAVVYFVPEAKSFKESLGMLHRTRAPYFHLYLAVTVSWLLVSLLLTPITSTTLTYPGGNIYVQTSFPSWYLVLTIAMTAPTLFYPSALLLSATRRATAPATRDSLTLLLVSWICFSTVGFFLFFLLGSTLPFAYEIGFVISSLFFYMLALAIRTPSGLGRFVTSHLLPQTIIRLGQRYLVLHDTGNKTLSFLSSTFRSIIEGGAKIIINGPHPNQLLEVLARNDPRFNRWMKAGRILNAAEDEKASAMKEAIAERLSLGPATKIYVTELETSDLQKTQFHSERETKDSHQPISQLFLLEARKAPRPQLADFLKRNSDIQLLDLSESRDTFSTLINLDHRKLQGSKILLEYDSSANYEEIVDRFFTEGIGNAELCALFTTKSSKLYRAIKGKKMIKIIAASSLVSAPDELPDGEVQIPDRELGLVASIASEFLENNKNMAVSFVFDSITELIRGELWEQVYSGIRQLIELLSVPNATAIFLANRDTFEPRFLGALKAAFSVQMRLESSGLQATKLPA